MPQIEYLPQLKLFKTGNTSMTTVEILNVGDT